MSHTFTIGELAKRIDVPPQDVLDAVLAAGVRVFWHEGQMFRTPEFLRVYLALRHYDSPVPGLEFDLDAAQTEALAKELQVEPAEILFDEVRS